LQGILDPVIQRNSFFGHHVNLLLAMIFDGRKHIRELGLRRVLKARMTKCKSICEFVTLELNFKAQQYFEMLDWTKVQITEPPVTADISVADICL